MSWPRRGPALACALAAIVTGCADDGGARAASAALPPAAASAARLGAATAMATAPTPPPEGPPAKVGRFTRAGPLNQARAFHTATALNDGRVLVTGGADGGAVLQDAEVYDPVTDTWSVVAGVMMKGTTATARQLHAATLLPGSGKVLLAGGMGVERLDASGQPIAEALGSCFLFDPATGAFEQTGSLGVARFWHLQTALRDGRVVVVSGFDQAGATSVVAETYDPATGAWTPVAQASDKHQWGAIATTSGSIAETIVHGGADVVPQGVLGFPAVRTERFDAASGAFTVGPTGALGEVFQAACNVVPDGRAIFAGGRVLRHDRLGVTDQVELFDPAVDAFVPGPRLSTPRFQSELASIGASGDQLLVGGLDGGGRWLSECEVWEAETNTIVGRLHLQVPRTNHRAVTLRDGRVLVIGGTTSSEQPTDACELHARSR